MPNEEHSITIKCGVSGKEVEKGCSQTDEGSPTVRDGFGTMMSTVMSTVMEPFLQHDM
jgi:hypothetical protein